MNQHTLFTKVQDYYADLVVKLGTARQEISMTYRVGYEDLDLATPEGKQQLKARVRQAAEEACKDIDAQFPLAGPKGARCVDAAVDAAKPQIRQALAVAAKPVTRM